MTIRKRWELAEPVTIAQKHSRAVIQSTLIEAKRDVLELVRDREELTIALKTALKLIADEPVPMERLAFVEYANNLVE